MARRKVGMFGGNSDKWRQEIIYLASLAFLALGSYSLGMTTINTLINEQYSISQSITGRMTANSAAIGMPFVFSDSDTYCDEAYGRPYPGMLEEERQFQEESRQSCRRNLQAQRRQFQAMDLAHSLFLLLIGGVFYRLSRKKNG